MNAPLGWEGPSVQKAWDYRVTAAIPHFETPELLPAVVGLLRLQTERPYFLVLDTGSCEATVRKLEALRAEDLEIHYIRAHSYRRPSDPVAVAMDLAMALCRTEYLFCTHADCFLRRQDMLEWMSAQCRPQPANVNSSHQNGDECSPVVGYQMSPRDWITDQWRGMVGHTATMLHMPTMHKIGATWSLRRAELWGTKVNTKDGWPDTETSLNLVLREEGIKPILIGNETNFERFVDDNIDHCRSYTSSRLYDRNYHRNAVTWSGDALREAEERIALWQSPSSICRLRQHKVKQAAEAYQRDWGKSVGGSTAEIRSALLPYLRQQTMFDCACGTCPSEEVRLQRLVDLR